MSDDTPRPLRSQRLTYLAVPCTVHHFLPASSRHRVTVHEWHEDARGQRVEHPAGTLDCKHTSGDFRYGDYSPTNRRGGRVHAEHVTTDRDDAYRWARDTAAAYRLAPPHVLAAAPLIIAPGTPDPATHEGVRPGRYWACEYPERPPTESVTWSHRCRGCLVHAVAVVVNNSADGDKVVRFSPDGKRAQRSVRHADLLAFLAHELGDVHLAAHVPSGSVAQGARALGYPVPDGLDESE